MCVLLPVTVHLPNKGMKECAAKGMPSAGPCTGPSTLTCHACGAVTYCSTTHQKFHWKEHTKECQRMKTQMRCKELTCNYPSLSINEMMSREKDTRCDFLKRRGIHLADLWILECGCSYFSSKNDIRLQGSWALPSNMCPCSEPQENISGIFKNWDDYYSWRRLLFDSPVALLLHWSLTIYHSIQLFATFLPNILPTSEKDLHIHYLGPEIELTQLPTFVELCALFPDTRISIDFIGPRIPRSRDGFHTELQGFAKCSDVACACKTSGCTEALTSSSNTVKCQREPTILLRFWKGFYHTRFDEVAKVSPPDIVVAPNAGIAAFTSWQPTIKLLSEKHVPAVFTDFCEEAAILATQCISTIPSSNLSLPVQINPFHHPLQIEEAVLNVPTYSNSFLLGIS